MVKPAGDRSISVTRALVELKTLDARIAKYQQQEFIRVAYHDRQVAQTFGEQAKRAMQSLTDLTAYRAALKGALVLSNAATRVKIGDWECSVGEAVERKQSIVQETEVLDTLRQQYQKALVERDRHNAAVTAEAEKLVLALAGNDKRNTESYANVQEDYEARKRAVLVDPLQLETLIAKMDRDISTFKSNVDVVLAESNASTMVAVSFAKLNA